MQTTLKQRICSDLAYIFNYYTLTLPITRTATPYRFYIHTSEATLGSKSLYFHTFKDPCLYKVLYYLCTTP